MSNPFVVQVDKWVMSTKNKLNLVLIGSSQDVVDVMQNIVSRQPSQWRPGVGMPVDTKFLWQSIDVNFKAPIKADQQNPYADKGPDSAPNWSRNRDMSVIEKMRAGDTLFVSWGAEYAPYVHYIHGRLFRDLGSQRWQSIVTKNANRLRSSASARR